MIDRKKLQTIDISLARRELEYESRQISRALRQLEKATSMLAAIEVKTKGGQHVVQQASVLVNAATSLLAPHA